ncbi:MAG: RsmB/NOP family class I SAM-dependent RNA methyltransferase [Magnetococcales bacterium]|nr:RsmB/NOP family class I SAM-dependent RNA methyltransferase [Magnetococcales bacterium]
MPPEPHDALLAARPLAAILNGVAPADTVLTRFFQERGSGPKERAAVGDIVFLALRHRRRLAHPADSASPEALATLALAELAGAPPSPPPEPLPPAVAVSLPDWLWETWAGRWGQEEAMQLATALNQPASTDLRVNRLRADRERVMAALAAAGMEAQPLPDLPDGLRMQRHHPVTTLPAFRQGLFEIQDAGSQWIPLLLAPRPGESVVDLCAGGGGKTLQMAAMMGNRGRILATDTDAGRLARLGPRMKRAGASIIRTRAIRHEGDPWLRAMTGKADAVLVDTPCSGTGTLRRHPEIKWRITPEQVAAFHDRQCALLNAGARLVRPGGGRLLYATCSLLRQENEAVVEAFLGQNRAFRLLPASRTLARRGEDGVYPEEPFLTLLPHVAGCDGFFAALFSRPS